MLAWEAYAVTTFFIFFFDIRETNAEFDATTREGKFYELNGVSWSYIKSHRTKLCGTSFRESME